MEKFPKIDKGPYVQLLLCQMACVVIQKRICEARNSIKTVLDWVVISDLTTMEKLGDNETILRDYVALDKRARFLRRDQGKAIGFMNIFRTTSRQELLIYFRIKQHSVMF